MKNAHLLPWAAGLFVGEGHAGTHGSSAPTQPSRRVVLALEMCDERAVRLFGKAIGTTKIYSRTIEWGDRSTQHWRVAFEGAKAEAALRLLYPFMRNTDKGLQTKKAFKKAGLDISDPSVRPVRIRKHSEETRRRISESMKRSHEQRRVSHG